MDLTDYVELQYDKLYYGSLDVGSPAQTVSIDIDTGSADLWVTARRCYSCSPQKARYDSDESSSANHTYMPFSEHYAQGYVSGELVQDVVAIGPLRVDQQHFGAVTYASDHYYDDPIDGILGLAFSTVGSSGKPTFFENVLKTGQVSNPVFSIHLTRMVEDGSQLCFGCYDSSKTTGSPIWLPVISKTYWTVSMEGISADGQQSILATTGDGVLPAAIDTGTSLIVIPNDMAVAFYATIPHSQDLSNTFAPGYFSYPCNSSLNISLTLGGYTFGMQTIDFNLGQLDESGEDCLGGIVGAPEGLDQNSAIIGDAFLKSWYSSYDYAGLRVGLAPSINNQGSL